MGNAIKMMIIASVVGALIGIYLTTLLNPPNNYFYFMGLFGIIGAGLANVVLLILVKTYWWVTS